MAEVDTRLQIQTDLLKLLTIKTGLPQDHWSIDERGLSTSPITCGHCIGSCCMFFIINNLTSNNVAYLLGRGTVPIDFITTDGMIIDPLVYEKILSQNSLRINESDRSQAALTKNEIKTATTCACQTCYGSCDIHSDKAHLPRVCGNGYLVGLKCLPVFIALGSPAAIEVQNILNRAERWISILAQARLGVEVKPRQFNFS